LPAGEDAESLMQEIYLKLWATRKSVQPGKNFEAYLFTIARNMVIDVMRKRLHRQKYLEGLFSQLQEGFGNNLDTMTMVNYSELEKKLFELIERLPEKQKEIFKLNRLEGLTYKEVAAKLNLSENTIDSQMRKTMAFFREEMKHFLQLIFII
jgi:RNA polymerase sigma-70 factor (ECF subfamily)